MRMKFILYMASVLLFSGISLSSVQAQEQQHYVILTKKVAQLQPILLAAEELKKEDGTYFGNFEVIICGQLIEEITEPAKIDKFISKAESLGVTLVACGFSLNKFNVNRAEVPKQMKIVENGILYNLQLQKKGYHSLGL